ncbi:MAG TPA: histidine phosphatase family protein [Myxococcaceae bacterium]|nr:histidine phosphatase family protein [Myxococcaceae bacterium]
MFHVNSRCHALLLAVLVLSGCASVQTPRTATAERTTTVFVVRHAEKDPTPGLKDPALTEAGQQRAEALRDRLSAHPVSALYTTDTVRTRSTLAPLAAARGLTPEVYDAREPALLVARLLERHRGQTVLVVGHSNTVLPLIDALGVARPVAELSDSDYDYLFEVTLPTEGVATVQAHRYGAGAR